MRQKVVRSTVIDAPVERVWAVLRDFNSHARWHRVVAESRIEGGEDAAQVGCVRDFVLQGGERIREQLIALDDRERRSTYCIVEADVPLRRYVATVTLKPVTDGRRTFWHWESTFETPPGRERELRELVASGVYEAGFADLREHLRRADDLRGDPRDGAASAPMPRALPVPARAVRVERYGGADALRPVELDVAAPGPGEVRLRQRAIGVNFIDVYLRRGAIAAMLPLPGVPGMEAAGSVVDVGDGVHGVMPGDRVAYVGARPGAYASVRNVPADWLVRLPAAVDDDVAAALLLKGATADFLIRDVGRVGPGTRLLVHAAAGGVGQLLAAWAKRLGARVVGTVSTEAKARVARAHGCDDVIVAADGRFADAVRGLVGGADVVVDGLGGPAAAENLAALAPRGHWISLGQAGGALAPVDPDALVAKSLTFSRPVVFDFLADAAERRARAERVWAALADSVFGTSLSIERHALGAAADAHARLESRATTGALVLVA